MKKLILILSIFGATHASAGILLEPYVGYHIAKGELSGFADDDITGLGFGGRIGWTLPLVFIAFDYSMAGVETDDGTTKTDADYTAMGLVVGAALPIIRVWAGYNFAAELEFDGGSKLEGAGMKAGLGFKLPVLPLSFNLEYILNEYDESDGASISNKYEQKGLFISVSAPFNL
ncbi:MAG: hypothetical protein V4596_01780 [Bdellovibrionota bacterium]